METKKCSKCKVIKSIHDFYNCKKCPHGLTLQCKQCMTEIRQVNAERQRLYMANLRKTDNERVKESRRKSWRGLDPRKKLFQQTKNRATRKGLEHTIQVSDIIIPEKCPILNVNFIVGTKNNYEFTPSLDRIDNNKGYTPENIQVLTKKANSMKNSGTPEELLLLADWIYKTFKK